MKAWFQKHSWARRALRTFLQAALGVMAAAVTEAAGVVENINLEAAIVLAVATGAAAVMNLGEGESTDDDRGDTSGV
jgi:hypothetical protein